MRARFIRFGLATLRKSYLYFIFPQLKESWWRGEAAEEGAARDPLPGALSRDRGAAKASVANLPKVRPCNSKEVVIKFVVAS